MSNALQLTYQQIIASVKRMPGLEKVALGEVIDAVRMAAVDIGNMPWPWNYAESNVIVPSPFSTNLDNSTISITDQTAAVTGNGSNWTSIVGALGWRIRFSNSNLDYIVASVNSATSITLAQNINLGTNQVAISYVLYQDTYNYPADYIMGSDVGLYQPIIRTRIQKIPRSRFEAVMNAGLRSFSTNIQMYYCDQSNGPTGLFRFRLGPPPSGPAELRLCYHSIADTFTIGVGSGLAIQTDLPDGFDDIITLVAASKLYDTLMMPGSSAPVKALAEGKIKLLKRAIAVQTIDDMSNPNIEVPDSSISQWGLTIARMS